MLNHFSLIYIFLNFALYLSIFLFAKLPEAYLPQGSSTEGESGLKIRPKGVVDGQQVNIPVLPLVGPEGRRRLG
ncbi:hypothetical protein ACOSP7_031305 [Xanthoceras sorbifolium]